MLAPSAGVDTILSLVSGIRKHYKAMRPPGRLGFFVPIAGAYHPSLYDEAAEIFQDQGTHILVHSHVEDKLCPWPQVEKIWKDITVRLTDAGKGGVYINAMTFNDRQLIDKHFHNITHFLCAQSRFWSEMLLAHESTAGYEFTQRCRTERLGVPLSIEEFEDYEPGYDLDLLDKSYFLQTALVAHYAVTSSAWKVWDDEIPKVIPWVIETAAGACSLRHQNLQTFSGLNHQRAVKWRP